MDKIKNYTFQLSQIGDSSIETRTHEEILTKNGDEKCFYFVYLEKLYLTQAKFPYKINYTGGEEKVKFALVAFDTNKGRFHNFGAYNVGDEYVLSQNGEYVPSLPSICMRVNELINFYIMQISIENFKNLYVPWFDIKDGKLICTYSYYEGTSDVEIPYVVGFTYNLFNLLGKYFDNDWGREVTFDENGEEILGDEAFYFVYPYISLFDLSLQSYKREEQFTITASHQVKSFFYPERDLKIYLSRAQDPNFVEGETGYAYHEISFTEENAIVDIDKYILLGNYNSIKVKADGKHYMKLAMVNVPNFTPSMEAAVLLTGSLIKVVDTFDNFKLFNLNVGDLLSSDDYSQLTYKKLMSITAENVTLENEHVADITGQIYTIIESHFKILDDMDNDNMALLIKKIYDIICQTQEITSLGPPSTKHSKIEFIN